MNRITVTLAGVFTLVVAMAAVANADHGWSRSSSCSPSYSGRSYGYQNSYGRDSGYGNYGNYSSGGWGAPSSAYRSSSWHNTSHYDYHPTEVRVHRNHLHVSPGHYDYDRSGHWHR